MSVWIAVCRKLAQRMSTYGLALSNYFTNDLSVKTSTLTKGTVREGK
jgi:hypothetical protein